MAIETDPTWTEARPDAGAKGLRTARAIGMLTYRNYETFVAQQSDSR
jgi:homoserine O-acetyltransferase